MKGLTDADIAPILPLTIAHPGEVYVLKGTEQLHLRTTESTVILIKSNADVLITEESHHNTYILIEEHARLRYNTSAKGDVMRTIYMQANSRLLWHDVSFDGSNAHNAVHLSGEGAEARFASLMFANRGVAQTANMIHEASHTSSNMLTRAVLLESAKGTYRGLIKINPKASGCDAHQREDTLLLGDQAKMDAVPILEISNNNVKCSHGVTLGQVDDEQLFYLESRGIERSDAVTMIVQGFFDQLLISMGEYGTQVREELLRKVQHA